MITLEITMANPLISIDYKGNQAYNRILKGGKRPPPFGMLALHARCRWPLKVANYYYHRTKTANCQGDRIFKVQRVL
jgi:hypothetical protein